MVVLVLFLNSFFEWKKSGRKKQPWRFLMKDESTFAVAGLWDHWNRPDGAVLETFTILGKYRKQKQQIINDIPL